MIQEYSAAAACEAALACRCGRPDPRAPACPPATNRQAAFPNGGVSLYGKYDGGLGLWGQRYRLRLFYSGGEAAQGLKSSCYIPCLVGPIGTKHGGARGGSRRHRDLGLELADTSRAWIP